VPKLNLRFTLPALLLWSPFAFVVLSAVVGSVAGQTLNKEYIYVGGKLVAIEQPATPTCTPSLVLQSQTVITGQNLVFEACNTLAAQNGFVIQSGGSVTFRAGTTITLLPGFTASPGSELRTVVGPAPLQ